MPVEEKLKVDKAHIVPSKYKTHKRTDGKTVNLVFFGGYYFSVSHVWFSEKI